MHSSPFGRMRKFDFPLCAREYTLPRGPKERCSLQLCPQSPFQADLFSAKGKAPAPAARYSICLLLTDLFIKAELLALYDWKNLLRNG